MPIDDQCCLYSHSCCLQVFVLAEQICQAIGHTFCYRRLHTLSTASDSAVADLLVCSLILLQVQMVARRRALRRGFVTFGSMSCLG